jgi:glycosyltransferase involved in cell wall biosynthesis
VSEPDKKKWTHRNVTAPRLRFLLDPVYVQAANLGSSSTYQKYVSLTRELVSRGHFVYWMLPEVSYTPHPIEDHPQVGVIRTAYIQDQFVVDGLITDDFFNLFNRIAGKYHIDAIVTGRTGAANMIKRVLESPRFHDNGGTYTDKHYGLPMAVLEEFPQTKKSQHVGQAYWLAQCQGYMSSELTIFLSDHNRSEVVEGMTPIYRPNTIQKWIDRCRIIPSGIETKELDKLYQPDRWKHEQGFRVISVGRILGVSYTQFLEWSRTLYASGLDAKLIVSLSGKLGGPMKKRLGKAQIDFTQPYYELIENNPRLAFLKLLRTVHAGIVPMSHLDCPVGVSEALYMGVPLVMPEADYQRTFFPDYPFVVKPSDRNALLGHLQFIKENPEEAREMLAPWRQRIKDTFDAPTNVRLLVDELETTARDPLPKFKTSGAILQFLTALEGERYTFADVVSYLRKSGFMGISIGDLGIRATWTYGRGAIHHAMRYCGYVDVCDGPEDVFVRRDVFEREAKIVNERAIPRRTRRKSA